LLNKTALPFNSLRLSLHRVKSVLLVTAGAILLISIFQFSSNPEQCLINGKTRLRLANYINTGIADDFIDRHCKRHVASFCSYKDSIKNFTKGNERFCNFSPSFVNGNDYSRIINGITLENDFTPPILKNIGAHFLTQLFNIQVNKYDRPDARSESFKAIYHWYNWESRECLISRQFQGWFWLDYLNYSQMILAPLVVCSLILLIIIFRHEKYFFLFNYIFFAFIIQALVSSVLYGYDGGIDAQTIWLLSLPMFIYVPEIKLIFRKQLA
jgi:hypothetical protein